MTELEKALYADVCWLKGVLEDRTVDRPAFRERADIAMKDAATELHSTLSKYMAHERTKDFTAEDYEAERMGGQR